MTANGVLSLSVEELQRLAIMFRGEFLEGVDLPDLHDFQAWCLAEREDIRRMQALILSTLIGRLAEQPVNALPHARQLVQIDPFNDAARVSLLQFLVALGRRDEAEQHFEAAVRVFKELGENAEANLIKTWRTLHARTAPPPAQAPAVGSVAELGAEIATATPELAPPRADDEKGPVLVGRSAERARLVQLLDDASAARDTKVVLLVSEPGLGKTSLVEEFLDVGRQRGAQAFVGHAYETERDFAYGPWIEALGGLPFVGAPANNGDGLDEKAFTEQSLQGGRGRLFAQIAQTVFGVGDGSGPVLLAFDDIQWCDEASANLLHHIVRSKWQRPLVVVMAARDGELADNPPVLAILRSLRHRRLLQEIRLGALSADEIREIVAGINPHLNAKRLVDDCAGNPLFAFELARNATSHVDELPRSLKELVRDRIERLPENSADLLRSKAQLKQIKGDENASTATIAPDAVPSAPIPDSPLPPDNPSIAVIPFVNLSDDAEQEYFADGITEDLTTALSNVRSFFVIDRSPSFTYKGQSVDVREVGRRLAVRYVLEGSVRKAGDKVRVSAQLVDVSSGKQVWADRFDGDLRDVFDLQDKIVASVVGALEPQLLRAELERMRQKRPENFDAYDLVLCGLSHMNKLSPEDTAAALNFFRRAIDADPNYARAYCCASWCYRRQVQLWGMILSEEDKAESLRLAQAALQADNTDPYVLWQVGFTVALVEQDIEGGLSLIDRSLAANSNSNRALLTSASVRTLSGDPQTAIEHATRAIQLSPLDTSMWVAFGVLANAYAQLGNYNEAVVWARRSVRLHREFLLAHIALIASLAQLGQQREAEMALSELQKIEPDFTLMSIRQRFPLDRFQSHQSFIEGLSKAGLPA